MTWAPFAALYFVCALISLGGAALGDEKVHYGQIELLAHGNFRIAETLLTTIPGYHIVMAALLWASHDISLGTARLLNALIGIGAIFAFRAARRSVVGSADIATSLQFALLPILFPYDFLVYTDIASLALVVTALAATLRGRHLLAGALMIGAMCVRQNNVVWLGLLAGVSLGQGGAAFLPWRAWLLRLWPYAIGILAFAAFWAWNGSISLSRLQSTMHPDWSFHPGNIYLTAALAAIFFPFQAIAGIKSLLRAIAKRPWLCVLPLGVFAIYWYSFHVDHPFNQVSTPLFLHNYLLLNCDANGFLRVLFGLLVLSGLCALANTSLTPAGAYFLFPVAALYLGASWMIEPRYSLLPLALWLALRRQRSRPEEAASVAVCAVLAVAGYLGMIYGYFVL